MKLDGGMIEQSDKIRWHRNSFCCLRQVTCAVLNLVLFPHSYTSWEYTLLQQTYCRQTSEDGNQSDLCFVSHTTLLWFESVCNDELELTLEQNKQNTNPYLVGVIQQNILQMLSNTTPKYIISKGGAVIVLDIAKLYFARECVGLCMLLDGHQSYIDHESKLLLLLADPSVLFPRADYC